MAPAAPKPAAAFDLPLPNFELGAAWVRWQGPELAVGVPAALAAFAVLAPDDPADAAAWPSRYAWFVAIAVVTILVGTVYAWERHKWRQARRRRKVRVQWERDPGTRKASLSKIEMGQGVITADCKIKGGSWDKLVAALDPDSGESLRALHIDREWGAPIRATITTAGCRNPTKKRNLTLHYLPLGDPFHLPFYEEPADGPRFFIGWSHATSADDDGKVWIDLDAMPHVAVRGASGTGKGFLIRLLTIQALRAGYLVLLLDGGNSGEHAVGDCGTLWRPMRPGMSIKDRLQAAIDSLEAVMDIIAIRARIGEELSSRGLAQSSRWIDFPDDIKAWQPRLCIVVDETSSLLAKGDPALEPLRRKLRALLGAEVLRGGRKAGVHILPMADQTATLTTSLPHGDTIQAEHVIVLGNMDQSHARGATDLPSLPKLPDGVEKLAGFYVRRGNPNVRELRIPPNGERQLLAAARWVSGVAA